MEISGRKHVEEIFRSDGQCIPAPSVGNLQVGQPRGRINLIILYGVVDAAEFTIAALPRGNVPGSLGVALHQSGVVARLPARHGARLEVVEEHGPETGKLRWRRREVGDLRLVVAVPARELD